ncbi:putative transmembrane domain protein, partial [Chlamydia psittaci 84-8471/1]
MHPLQSPSHLGSNAASILVIKERKAQTCIADSLRKHAFAIANSVFLALITTFATLMICGLTQPLIILGL